MKVSAEDVVYMAQLSRLNVPENELEKMTEQFNQILDYAEILQKLDTTGIEASSSVLHVSNVLREDVVKEGVSHEDALLNAPAVHNDGFKVPRVIG